MHNQKGFTPIVIVLIVLVLTGIGGISYYLINKQTQLPGSNKQIDDVNWITYNSKEYGFSIDYPKDWGSGVNILSNNSLVFCPPENRELSNSDDICKLKDNGSHMPKFQSPTILLFSYDRDQGTNNSNYHYLGLNNGKYFYLFNEDANLEPILNKMIYTFKFTNIQKQSQAENTSWKEYELKKSNTDLSLIGIRDDGTEDVIVSSMKSLTKWTEMYYPKKVSFPPYSNNIFFVKYLSETGHSAGFYMLNIKTLELKELKIVGEIYENYYNYISIKSPDGFKIASLGHDKLYLLDLENDKATVLAQAKSGEVFYPAGNVPDFIWLSNNTIQYPIYYQKDIEGGIDKVIETKKISF